MPFYPACPAILSTKASGDGGSQPTHGGQASAEAMSKDRRVEGQPFYPACPAIVRPPLAGRRRRKPVEGQSLFTLVKINVDSRHRAGGHEWFLWVQ